MYYGILFEHSMKWSIWAIWLHAIFDATSDLYSSQHKYY